MQSINFMIFLPFIRSYMYMSQRINISVEYTILNFIPVNEAWNFNELPQAGQP